MPGKRDGILITGGAGFIGRALLQVALDNNCRVGVYDNLSFGRKSNLDLFGDAVAFFEADIRDEPSFNRACREFNPGYVIHLAALHFIPYCDAHPKETLEVNVGGTHTVLSVCENLGIETAVFASTGALYTSATHPLRESQDPPLPSDIYGLSKLLGENICAYFNANTKLNCRVARLFNVYGPYETNPHLIPHMLQSLKKGSQIQLGNIHTKRDYVYVEDLANILYRYLTIERPQESTMNIGTGNEYSAREIVDRISELLGIPIEVLSDPERVRSIDKAHQIADTSRMMGLTGYAPKHGMLEGLRKLLAHEELL